ncbi:MAG: HAD-IC family P-type ATPase, partial [Candidatus Levybacteria bacterium]|nr:HAD-IC family P-type ATPase [Candidatus Levybacteria bacterium]
MFPNEKGLSNEEVINRQQQYGLNVLPEKPPPSHFTLIVQQFKNPLIYVLLLAVLVTLVIGHLPDAMIIFLAVVVNTVLGFIQERKASNALHALKHYVTNHVVVIRNGKRVSIETSQIVPGDIVILSQGVKVPADGKLIHANRLYLDESILTGESMSVKKVQKDPVFMGTTIASGQAVMLVENTGANTKMGAIALQIQEAEEDTPLQRQLKGFSKQLVAVVGALTIFVFIIGVLYRFSVMDMFVTSVALAVSSIPEGLIVSMTVILAIGMQKILKRRGLVRKLAAAETLGGVTVICIDKTGTLTQGKMKVVDTIGNEKDLAQQVLLANDLDDPIVIAAFEWGRTIISDFVSEHQRLDSIPFSSRERFFCSLHEWSNDGNRLYVNGAPDLLLQWTTLAEDKKEEIVAVIDNLTKQGKRLIGFARKDVPSDKQDLDTSDAKNGLIWVGMLAFSDSVRVGVKDALEQAMGAGIHTVVITGDYSKTSEFVLSELGISLSSKEIITGDKLEGLSVEELSRKVRSIRLFARTTPDQKLAIVEALKKRGEIVAMMGDGVNDAPALHEADIGIAVGEATDVAKESADLVILDSNFSTIVGAIEEGRAMFENIRKIILYLMCDAFAEIVVISGGIILGLPLPITAMQILWVNIISDGFPNLALTIDPKRAGIMKEKPRLSSERLINKWMTTLIGFVSLIAGLITLASFIVVYKTSNDLVVARSMAFIMLGLNSLTYVFSVRALMTPFWKNHLFENRWLIVAVIAGFGLQVLPFSLPSLRQFFGLSSLNPVYWLIAIGLSIFMFFVVEIFKFVYHFKVAKN